MMNNSVADRGGRCKPCFMAFQRNCERTGQGRTTAADGRAFKNGGDGARAQVSHKFLMFADVTNASRALYHPRSKTSDGSESPPSPSGSVGVKGSGHQVIVEVVGDTKACMNESVLGTKSRLLTKELRPRPPYRSTPKLVPAAILI